MVIALEKVKVEVTHNIALFVVLNTALFQDKLIDILSYISKDNKQFISNHRKSKTGGGVGIYLHNDLQYKILNDNNNAYSATSFGFAMV